MCQDQYISKIVNRFNRACKTAARTPLPTEDLQPHDGQATESQIHDYQQKINSAVYAASTTRPGVARSVNKLAEFLTNPSKLIDAIDQVLTYTALPLVSLSSVRPLSIDRWPGCSPAAACSAACSAAFFRIWAHWSREVLTRSGLISVWVTGVFISGSAVSGTVWEIGESGANAGWSSDPWSNLENSASAAARSLVSTLEGRGNTARQAGAGTSSSSRVSDSGFSRTGSGAGSVLVS